jgi:hypothetical protein
MLIESATRIQKRLDLWIGIDVPERQVEDQSILGVLRREP